MATCTHWSLKGKSSFSSATGVVPEPLTVPVIVSPVPQVGRTVEGVMATPVGHAGRW